MALKYEINPPAPGVDVSRYQGNVDWPRVKAAGYAFAFVRLGYANGDGSIVADPYFERNVTGAAAAGWMWACIFTATSTARPMPASPPPACWSCWRSTPSLCRWCWITSTRPNIRNSAGRRTPAICNTSWPASARAGYLPMFYSYTSFVNSYMDMAALDRYEGLWIANYTGKIGVDNAAVWQHSSSGSVPAFRAGAI